MLSRKMNQMNISHVRARGRELKRLLHVRGLLRVAHAADATAYSGFVCSPYSVTQIGTAGGTTSASRRRTCSSSRSRRSGTRPSGRGRARRRSGTDASPRRRTGASGSPRRAAARRSPVRPSRCRRRSGGCLPRFEVSPAATSAFGLPGLDALVGGHVELGVDARADDLAALVNCGVRNCCRFGSFQTEKRVTTP